jgi:integrase
VSGDLRDRKNQFLGGNMKDNPAFPERVEHKSCTATIYFQRNRKAVRYEVKYYDLDGSKQRLTFPTYSSAKKFAETAVKEIVANREHFITLRGREAFEYQTAVEIVGPLGLSIPQALTLLAELHRQLAGQGTPAEAVKYFLENRPQKSPDTTVREVVDQLLGLKEKEGEVGKIYLRDLRVRLHKFAEAFQCPISRVSPAEIRDYLLARDVSTRTRHNLRTTLTTLFNFARNEGYLPADHKGVPRPTKRSRLKLAIKVFTPEEMSKLLSGATGDQLVALAIIGFAGIRAQELMRLQWEHLDFEERHIIVPDTIAKCEERRIVPMADNLHAWLLPYRKASGPVCPFSNLAIVFARTAKRAGVAWKRNGLRHSFISYRVAFIKNVGQVAFEAGNSAQMIHRHYLKVVTEAVAKAWFAIMPSQPANVIQAPKPAVEDGAAVSFAG